MGKYQTLRLTPYAWAKLIHFRDLSKNEVGLMGISDPEDLLLVIDVVLVKQEVSIASTDFDEDGIADYFEEQVEKGIAMERCGRIWIHTHPRIGAGPSGTDEKTFQEAFGGPEWAVMAILDKDGDKSARIKFNIGPGGSSEIDFEVDWETYFQGVDKATCDAWTEDYKRLVSEKQYTYASKPYYTAAGGTVPSKYQPSGKQPYTVDCYGGVQRTVWAYTHLDAWELARNLYKGDAYAVYAEHSGVTITDDKDEDTDLELVKDYSDVPAGWDDWTDEEKAEWDAAMDEQRRLDEEDELDREEEEWEETLAAEADSISGPSGFSDSPAEPGTKYTDSDDYYLQNDRSPVNAPDI